MTTAYSHLKLKKQLQLINATVSTDTYNLGDQFFKEIVLRLNEALDADYTFIGRLNKDADAIEVLSLVHKGVVIDNFMYYLKHTPCENVVGQKPCSYKKGICELFPKDQLLKDMGIEAYIGVPLYDSKTNPTGILVCLYNDAIEDAYAIESVMMIFASRAGAELEHKQLYSKLEQYQQALQKKVDERTIELSIKNKELEKSYKALNDQHRIIKDKNKALHVTMQNLKNAQAQLIQAEKMASLGILTAGVAHEINNPLNYILGGFTGLKNYINDTNGHTEYTETLLLSIKTGVDQIAAIVSSLGHFSRSNDSFDEACDIHIILNNCLIMLYQKINAHITIKKKYSPLKLVTKGNDGKLHQVILNVLNNAIEAIKETGTITIQTSLRANELNIDIEDTGCGIDENDLQQVLDPFFTTKDPGKGTGLGLAISYTIIKEHGGNINLDSTLRKGTKVSITIPYKPVNHE